MSDRRLIPVHRSLVRPLLVAGGERNLVMLNVIIAGGMVFGIGSVYAAVLGVAQFLMVQWGLRKLAAKDPQFQAVYTRHIYYQDFYSPRAHFSARAPLVKYFD